MSNFDLGRFTYATKKAAQADARSILRGTRPGTTLGALMVAAMKALKSTT